jgi:site-specific recombinase XerD
MRCGRGCSMARKCGMDWSVGITCLKRACNARWARHGVKKAVTPQCCCGSPFATHLLEAGYDSCTVQDLLRHKDVVTTEIQTHNVIFEF